MYEIFETKEIEIRGVVNKKQVQKALMQHLPGSTKIIKITEKGLGRWLVTVQLQAGGYNDY